MKLIRHLTNEAAFPDGCVLTIGNFDGVHLGHQMVLSYAKKQGLQLDLPVVVMCFEPQPLEFFQKDAAPARLSTARDKLLQLSSQGVDALILLRFDQGMANRTADEFVDMLCKKIHIKSLIVGDDFHFGKGREGDFSHLKEAGEQRGFSVHNAASFKLSANRVSSTLIRKMLAQGDLQQASEFLGRPFSMTGRVIYGDQRGRTLGFPTANVKVKNRKTPLKGVFAVTIKTSSGRCYRGVANVGVRPTVEATAVISLEAHLFDFDGDLYGQKVTVVFMEKLRDEAKFATLDALTQQISDDKKQAERYFQNNSTSQ